ncbi:MAG: DciA family protein [Pseudomonadota bacterium]
MTYYQVIKYECCMVKLSSKTLGPRGNAYRKPYIHAKSLGTLFPKITKHIFEKYGFSTSQLISEWKTIVGSDLAAYTRPEKLKWPKYNPELLGEGKTSGVVTLSKNSRKRQGATLVLRVESARSLEVQFSKDQIMSRINTYYGYEAVVDLRLLQAPLSPVMTSTSPFNVSAAKPQNVRSLPKSIPATLQNIQNSDLKQALERMAKGVQLRQVEDVDTSHAMSANRS